MGKFDKRLPGEKEGERKLPGKRRKFAGVTDAAADRALMSKTAEKLLRTKADDVLDINKAIGKFEAEARQQRHVAKQAAGDGDSSRKGGKKGRQQQGGKQAGGKGGKGGRGGGAKGKGGREGGKSSAGLKARGAVSKKGGKRGK
jgi:regulator of ribosome biosynthesis